MRSGVLVCEYDTRTFISRRESNTFTFSHSHFLVCFVSAVVEKSVDVLIGFSFFLLLIPVNILSINIK